MPEPDVCAPIDPNGNLAADGLTSYTWNARNQLVGMSGVTSASFAYDALGRRQSKTISGTATNFLYDKLNLVQELSNGTPSANLLSGSLIDETLTRSDSNGSTTLLTDAQRSTIGLADASGAVQTSYTFEPFGQTQVSGSPSANATEFASRENDGVGLYYYRSRFYSPALQRFLSDDLGLRRERTVRSEERQLGRKRLERRSSAGSKRGARRDASSDRQCGSLLHGARQVLRTVLGSPALR